MVNHDEATPVVIHTISGFRIEGLIALLPGSRLTDYVMGAHGFIAVAEVAVSDRAGKALFTAPFLDVAVSAIELILPSAGIVPAGTSAKKQAAAKRRR